MEIVKKSKNNINIIVTTLKEGAILVLPTDTVYGLVCDAGNKKAVEKIFKIKKRDKLKPLGIFVKDIKTAKKFANVAKEQEKFLSNSKNTVILKARLRKASARQGKKNLSASSGQEILSSLVCKNNTIGIRIPKYKFLNLILDKFKKPIAQTSANISLRPATTKIKDILKQFKNDDLLIVDAGDLPKNKPSAIIDLTDGNIKTLRK